MRAVIVDDEPLARARLERLLTGLAIRCVASGETGLAAIALTEKFAPDFLFLDISMPVMDGLEAAKKISELDMPPAIIFCTAHDEHAIEAFQTSAAAYLLKPVFEDALRAAIDKAGKLTRVLKGAALETLRPVEMLSVRASGETMRVPVTEFVYFKSVEKNVYGVHLDGSETLLEYSLKELEETLSESVVCTYRGTLANRYHLLQMSRSAEGKVTVLMRNQVVLDVSRRQLTEVKKCFV